MDPRKIPNNARMQYDIDEQQKVAAEFLESKKKEDPTLKQVKRAEWLNLALIAVEGGKWEEVRDYANRSEQIEEKDAEADAICGYVKAVRLRELAQPGQLEAAGAIFKRILAHPERLSLWLVSNTLRNYALVFVKQNKWEEAAALFKQALDTTLVDSKNEPELAGSLPALYNYFSLATCRAAMASNQQDRLREGLQSFDQTTAIYDEFFALQKIPESRRSLSNDFMSHLTHRGMVYCECGEQSAAVGLDLRSCFENAGAALRYAYDARKQLYKGNPTTPSNAQRLGDSAYWLGRACLGIKQDKDAKRYFTEARTYYVSAHAGPQAHTVDRYLDRLLIAELEASREQLKRELAEAKRGAQAGVTRLILNVLRRYEDSWWYKKPSVDRRANYLLLKERLNTPANYLPKTRENLLDWIGKARTSAVKADTEACARHLTGGQGRYLEALNTAEEAVHQTLRPGPGSRG